MSVRPMQVRIAVADETARGGARAVDVELSDSAAVADLLGALGGEDAAAGGVLLVDGRAVPERCLAADAGIARGSLLSWPTGAALPPRPAGVGASGVVAELQVVGGLRAGARHLLGAGSYVLGRGPSADIDLGSDTVSVQHACLVVASDGSCRVADCGSLNGTRLDGDWVTAAVEVAPGALLQLGAVQVVTSPPTASDAPALAPPSSSGLVTFDRSPRTAVSVRRAPLVVPTPPADSGAAPRFHWAATITPALLGLGMVALTGNMSFALFTLLSPVVGIGTWWEERRRHRRDRARDAAAYTVAVAAFRRSLEEARVEEVTHRRLVVPCLPETLRRVAEPSRRLWERRPSHEDVMRCSVGLGPSNWVPALETRARELPAEVAAAVDEQGELTDVPITVELTAGTCLGIVGQRETALAVARALVIQAAAHHGPADLRIAVLTDAAAEPEWAWAGWLPHVVGPDDDALPLLACTAGARTTLLDQLLASPVSTPTTPWAPSAEVSAREPLHLVVMDVEGLTQGRGSTARELLAGAGVPCSAIVIADRVDRLPAACRTVVVADGSAGAGSVSEPAAGATVSGVLLGGIDDATAREVARAMARFEDAELVDATGDLPSRIDLLPLLGLRGDTITAADLAQRWTTRDPRGPLVAPVGVSERGVVHLDVVGDGPHGLIAGTTGSGKSELLRSIVASLAASASPDDLVFVLIDYKGGSAFAECARLPHTVGMVTDLDEHLGRRALTCLEAELKHREQLLRTAGVADLPEYIAAGLPHGPLPRLLVVIDEFATMAAELPDFIDALVGVAQRGRSLGVHLLLATQRPGGAVKDNIRANTNLRISLRVQDPADSSDVIGSPVAAALRRHQPGRAYLRLGPGETTPFQSALVTGSTSGGVAPSTVTVRAPGAQPPATMPTPDGPTDLVSLVNATVNAAALLAVAAPRLPWPDPLPTSVSRTDLATAHPSSGWSAPIGLLDDPARQLRGTYSWESTTGNLLVYGVAGSGTTTTLATLALSLASTYDPAQCHLYVFDLGSQLLAPLAGLPHVAAVVSPAERERQERIVRRLREEVARRQRLFAEGGARDLEDYQRRGAAPLPAVVLLLDNWSAFESLFDDVPGMAIRDDLTRVVADGPPLGIYVVGTADRTLAVPAAVATLIPAKLLMQLPDKHDYAGFGVPAGVVPELVLGRGIDTRTGLEVQIATPTDAPLAETVADIAASSPIVAAALRPRPVGTLAEEIKLADVIDAGDLTGDSWRVPVGLSASQLEAALLPLPPGEHALVTGPGRSGKSTMLAAIAAAVVTARPDVTISVIAPRPSPVADAAYVDRVVRDPHDVGALIDDLLAASGPQLLLVDDADVVEDAAGDLGRLLRDRRPDLHVVAAGRPDPLRASYGHFTQEIRRSRVGIALRPRVDVDGDLWGVLLPRYGPTRFTEGRGYLVVDGEVDLMQGAMP